LRGCHQLEETVWQVGRYDRNAGQTGTRFSHHVGRGCDLAVSSADPGGQNAEGKLLTVEIDTVGKLGRKLVVWAFLEGVRS